MPIRTALVTAIMNMIAYKRKDLIVYLNLCENYKAQLILPLLVSHRVSLDKGCFEGYFLDWSGTIGS